MIKRDPATAESDSTVEAVPDSFAAAPTRRTVLKIGAAAFGLGAAGLGGAVALAQDSPPGGGPGGGDQTLDAFVGVTTDGNVIPDLFPINATGIATTPVVEAAIAFLAALTDDQRAATLFAVDDDEWRMWSNVDGYQRQGTSLREMDEAQRTAAMALLEVSLSGAGFEKVDATMKLNHTEGELMGDMDTFDEDLYWFTVMGEPSATEPWGWQLDGHHLVVNYFVLGDQVAMTPVFMGAEPTVAPEGTAYAGLSILITEQDQGLAMVNSLTAEQQAVAIINPAKSDGDMQAGAFSDNAVIPSAGISATELTTEQQEQLLALIAEWVGNLADDHAGVKMEEIRTHLDETYFAWVGDTGAEAVFYYRVQSPVILIEFDHQSPGPLGQRSDYYGGASGPQRAHIHAIVRTPNGNDYGKDLLAEHYATSAHHSGTVLAGAALVGALALAIPRPILPPRYRGNKPVSNAPMGAAPLVYDAAGEVAWGEVWGGYCDLALAGGPPHRGTILKAPDPEEVRANPSEQARVLDELERALCTITGWEVRRDGTPGWIGFVCPDVTDAAWLRRAILVENVAARYEGNILYLPAGPAFRLEHEIKNVVTAVAKAHHYWTEHAASSE